VALQHSALCTGVAGSSRLVKLSRCGRRLLVIDCNIRKLPRREKGGAVAVPDVMQPRCYRKITRPYDDSLSMSKTVLITGCSSGFGRATAQVFSNNGWNVVATMRDVRGADDLANDHNMLVARLDVQDRSSIAEAVERAIECFGRIDALVNNAGFGLHGIFETSSPEKIQEQFDVNLFGVMNVTRALLPHFRANRGGTIVNISSGAGVFTLPLISLYCASKFALEGFSEALTYELAPLGITVKDRRARRLTEHKFLHAQPGTSDSRGNPPRL
jgi:NADP-dependent 3-hydroxy acid dehydrogenase YdfG